MSDSTRVDGRPGTGTTRNGFVDLMRGTAILGVVGIHFGGSFVTSQNAWTPSFAVGLIINQLFHFAVPLFLFIAGYLSFSGDGAGPGQKAFHYYRGRLKRILPTYLVVSAISFLLFGHLGRWAALPTFGDQIQWLISRVGFYGIEGTLYFIPLIISCYLIQPLVRRLPSLVARWSGRRTPEATWAVILTAAFLILHLALALACYTDRLDYYTWARPNALFWMVYFFAGVQLKRFGLRWEGNWFAIVTGAIIATFAMGWNLVRLFDPAIVGSTFNQSRIDLAYAAPLVVVFNLAVVSVVALGIAARWDAKLGLLARFGNASFSIYMWHIIVLYLVAWRHPEVLSACRELPELIPLICFFTCLVIWIAGEALVYLLRCFARLRWTMQREAAVLNGP